MQQDDRVLRARVTPLAIVEAEAIGLDELVAGLVRGGHRDRNSLSPPRAQTHGLPSKTGTHVGFLCYARCLLRAAPNHAPGNVPPAYAGGRSHSTTHAIVDRPRSHRGTEEDCMRPALRFGLTAGAIVGLLVALSSSLSAQEGGTVQVGGNDDLGGFLVGPDGMTLYVFSNDTAGVSNCTGDCAVNWPPLTATGEPTAGDGVEGTLATIERDDGTTQVTLDSQPLYYWINDEAEGDATGQGVGGVWFVVEAAAMQATATPTATPTAAATATATAAATGTPAGTSTPTSPAPGGTGGGGIGGGGGGATLLVTAGLLLGAALLVGAGRVAVRRR
ncbi:MAG: hypothetical protein GEU80_11015 [Dehalococcoidia bacterium]|nr:hypothetical protein [Dehalococcoidia bacterium]